MGDVMPTAVRMMAEVAAGGDVGKLDDMMKKGELYSVKYLPLLWERMFNESSKILGTFQGTSVYHKGLAGKRREEWMRDFGEQGGYQGLTTFWQTLGQIWGEAGDSAKIAGDMFVRASEIVSGIMLIPSELFRWLDGENDARNFWQSLFGDYQSSGMPEIKDSIKAVWEGVKNLTADLVTLFVDVMQSPALRAVFSLISGSLGLIVDGLRRIIQLADVFYLTLHGRFGEAYTRLTQFDKERVDRGIRDTAESHAQTALEKEWGVPRHKWTEEQRQQFQERVPLYEARAKVEIEREHTRKLDPYAESRNNLVSKVYGFMGRFQAPDVPRLLPQEAARPSFRPNAIPTYLMNPQASTNLVNQRRNDVPLRGVRDSTPQPQQLHVFHSIKLDADVRSESSAEAITTSLDQWVVRANAQFPKAPQ
jgi:hypothetical protein